MKIIRYRMLIINTCYLEAEVKLKNGDIVYPNIDVPKENGIKIDKNHPYYGSELVYNRPLDQIGLENDVDNYTYIMNERENMELFDTLIELWNKNPIFAADAVWHTYEK